MKLDGVIYECLDKREGGTLSGIVRLHPVPGGMEIHHLEGRDEAFPLGDDADLEDNESAESVIIHTDQGSVVFVVLHLVDFLKRGGGAAYTIPDIPDTTALHRYFWGRLDAMWN